MSLLKVIVIICPKRPTSATIYEEEEGDPQIPYGMSGRENVLVPQEDQ